MSEPEEDLSASVPEGFAPPVGSAEDPKQPGVRLAELRHNRARTANHPGEPAWLMWFMIGLLVLILLPAAAWVFGVWGMLILIGLGIVGLLVAIFVRLGRR